MTKTSHDDERLNPGDPSSRSRQSRERVMQDIRAAAVTEFSRSGLKGTSTQTIAERAGLKKSQLHYYIASKEDLYKELLYDVIKKWQEFSLELGREESPATSLSEYIALKLEYSIKYPEMSKISAREILDGGLNINPYWPELRESTQKNVDCINRWIERGLVQPLDAHQLLLNIWSITQSYADFALQVREIKGLPPDAAFDLDAIIKDVKAFILRGCGIKDDEASQGRSAFRHQSSPV